MSRQDWFNGPVCGTDNCRSRLYRNQDGLTICQFGHVLEGAVEYNDDPDAGGIVQTRRLNTISFDERGHLSSAVVSNSQTIKTKLNRLYGEDAMALYYRCLQILLKKELKIFIDLFFSEGIRHDLTLIVKNNWVKLLSTDELQENHPKRQVIDTLDLICMIYISALQLQAYPIYIPDLIDNIKLNTIPYIRTLHLIPKHMLDQLPTVYHNRLQPYSLPENSQIYKLLQTTGWRTVGATLRIPTSFYFPFIFRILSEHFLLVNAVDLFVSAFNVLKSTPSFEINFRIKKFIQKFPEIYISSVLIILIRENFRSNDNLKPWLYELNKYELNNEYNSGGTSLLNWSDDKVDKYCDWIYDNLIPKKAKLNDDNTEALNTMEKRLFQIFSLDNDIENTAPETNETPMYLALRSIMNGSELKESGGLQELDTKLDAKLSNILGL